MKLFDRLIDHVVDRVMARAQQNRPTMTVNNIHNIASRVEAEWDGRSA